MGRKRKRKRTAAPAEGDLKSAEGEIYASSYSGGVGDDNGGGGRAATDYSGLVEASSQPAPEKTKTGKDGREGGERRSRRSTNIKFQRKRDGYRFVKRVPACFRLGKHKKNEILVTRKRKLVSLFRRALKLLDPINYRTTEKITVILRAMGAAIPHCAKLALMIKQHWDGRESICEGNVIGETKDKDVFGERKERSEIGDSTLNTQSDSSSKDTDPRLDQRSRNYQQQQQQQRQQQHQREIPECQISLDITTGSAVLYDDLEPFKEGLAPITQTRITSTMTIAVTRRQPELR